MHYVYLIQNEHDATYYGSTNNLRQRMQEHNKGRVPSTRGHAWRLVYYEAYLSEKDAREREQRLKYHGQALAHLKRRIRCSLNEPKV